MAPQSAGFESADDEGQVEKRPQQGSVHGGGDRGGRSWRPMYAARKKSVTGNHSIQFSEMNALTLTEKLDDESRAPDRSAPAPR